MTVSEYKSLADLLLIILGIIVASYILWEVKDVFVMIVVAIFKVKTLSDALVVLLIVAFGVTLVGDYVAFGLVQKIFRVDVDSRVAIATNMLPHAIMIAILLVRMFALLTVPARARTSTLWVAPESSAPVFLIALAGVIDAGVYCLRHFLPQFYAWIDSPWQDFWLHCALLAVLTWSLAASVFLAARLQPGR